MSEENISGADIEPMGELKENINGNKTEHDTVRKPRYTFEIEERDLEDAMKMGKMIKKNQALSRASPAFIAKFLFMETLKEYRKAGLI